MIGLVRFMEEPYSAENVVIDPATAGQLITRVRGGRSAFARLCGIFETEYPRLLEEIETSRQAQDWNRLRAAAHNLKGSASVLGAVRVRACAGILNQSAMEGQEPPETALEALPAEIDRFLSEARELNSTPAVS
jgi:HPt (histidine-containing phosphotransfer) domain-containing protein